MREQRVIAKHRVVMVYGLTCANNRCGAVRQYGPFYTAVPLKTLVRICRREDYEHSTHPETIGLIVYKRKHGRK